MTCQTDLAAFLLRIALGVMALAHGLLKVLVFTLPGTAGFFAQLGFPGWLAYPVAYGEIIAGVLLLAGVGVRAVSLALIPILLGASYVHFANGWVFSNANGGWEYPAYLVILAVAQALLGPGKYAVSLPSRRRTT